MIASLMFFNLSNVTCRRASSAEAGWDDCKMPPNMTLYRSMDTLGISTSRKGPASPPLVSNRYGMFSKKCVIRELSSMWGSSRRWIRCCLGSAADWDRLTGGLYLAVLLFVEEPPLELVVRA